MWITPYSQKNLQILHPYLYTDTTLKSTRTGHITNGGNNIILNPTFEDGLSNWSAKGCNIVLHESMGDGKVLPLYGKLFASATNRTERWNGIEQDITGRVQPKLAYEVTAVVRYLVAMSPMLATDKDWMQLQGKFLLNGSLSRVIIFLEGPPPGTDILINSLVVKHVEKVPHSLRPIMKINAAGKRYLALKKEWLSHARVHIDDAQGEFRFRGFYGTYNTEINFHTKKINRTFVVDKVESPLPFGD
ncbi:hypothetical protein REPUB_Repub02eG0066800 [Reevesia pubescens]